MVEIPLMTLENMAKYIEMSEFQLDFDEFSSSSLIRQMNWHLEMGNAVVRIEISEKVKNSNFLAITCTTQKRYLSRQTEVLDLLNHLNVGFEFSRTLSPRGEFSLQYYGFYPVLAKWPQETFDTLLSNVLLSFEESYRALEEHPAYASSPVPQV
ncbi:YbjN domain-containing protein (plasmid) [Deinococcus psychrotolerans]|uniref:YbjN domain-containing protein n=1 Tax=Deinococcus psychrotolerans TaxID=2489213 RepID=A0A3G8YRT5_9DEIO|nr:YbjN domain-containing protein [Deinococcus psychrotolerans]AZI45254.1 YbjN domain-containing protein [Deinococcus psychrotolerans]